VELFRGSEPALPLRARSKGREDQGKEEGPRSDAADHLSTKGVAMSAIVLPFPILRRHGFVQRQAAHAAYMHPDASARYVEYQLRVQRDAMRRRGIAENLIARELQLMEAAIRQGLLQAITVDA
jgi:hypothetical protein